ncbi:DNA-binding transcriptional regulator, FadR family [Tranquillimonas rosea]|uniref:DNA-binding transcriptional regulator, FadR family n=1 Tax=Tranquillimonas rosea TaxID=641238 RepID=A0A1H9RMF5_9RHOB|nr:FadR/GntR family transcriptional regulator [Tranquillimonas rosea]SER73273.1 DNA-binding transcriptional regulator, FadR family [Tranquillimonas rosea]
MERGETAKTGGRRNLVATLVSALRDEITSGRFVPGDRLPSEARLTERFDVSRTVVREAIAGLRADGLVEPRQGAGVFVLQPPPDPPGLFEIADYEKISSIIEMLELRVAVEMEAAALAALRHSPAQEETIFAAELAVREGMAEGRPTTEADLAFHLAIADATNNPRFREFLEALGVSMIPRAALQAENGTRSPTDYIEMISAEHLSIAEAISAGEPERAREAMRGHLKKSQGRYRELLRAKR